MCFQPTAFHTYGQLTSNLILQTIGDFLHMSNGILKIALCLIALLPFSIQGNAALADTKGTEISPYAINEGRTGLPFDLRWGMTKQEVQSHLKALDMYRVVDENSPDTIIYSVPAPDTNTKDGLFLDFYN